MICHQCKTQSLTTDLTCTQCGADLVGKTGGANSPPIQKKVPLNPRYYGQIASWVVICLFVLLYKLVLPAFIVSTIWENSTIFGVGVALSWIAGRLIGKILAQKKAN
ncbi:hypothetical protein RGU75_01360 [Glaciimonas sp. CA11.2]|uniref:hypothetical protein n=1 Tax=Glaciimonas sp. CA11.2 TaxID=3048601 RepID=UPI002AB5B223|nr:hypothetical protein [Glaciimonas sp. CA11.2]MDY7544885.1 hypothetical protein [Glaciimonas sp. CA11.2]